MCWLPPFIHWLFWPTPAYAAAQRCVDSLWRDRAAWSAKAIRNTANMGWFSSDRTIREYARDIWNVPTR